MTFRRHHHHHVFTITNTHTKPPCCDHQLEQYQQQPLLVDLHLRHGQRRQRSNYNGWKYHYVVCLSLLLIISHLPTTAGARYFRQPSNGNTNSNGNGNANGRDFGSVSFRQNNNDNGGSDGADGTDGGTPTPGGSENNNDNDVDDSDFDSGRNPAQVSASVSQQQEEQQGQQEKDETEIAAEFFGEFETDFPTHYSPTEAPTFVPTFNGTAEASSVSANPTQRPTSVSSSQKQQGSDYLFATTSNATANTNVTNANSGKDDDRGDQANVENDATKAPTSTTSNSTSSNNNHNSTQPAITRRPSERPTLPPTQWPTLSQTQPTAQGNNTETTQPTWAPTTLEETTFPTITSAPLNLEPVFPAPTMDPSNTTLQDEGFDMGMLTMNDTDTVANDDDLFGAEGTFTPDDIADASMTTDYPTSAPVTLPTISGVRPEQASPTDVPEHPVAGQVSLELQGILTPFYEGTRIIFLASAEEFIASSSKDKVADIRVMVIYQRLAKSGGDGTRQRQRRRLQERTLQEQTVLQVDLGVDGLAYEEGFSREEWDLWLYNLFQDQGLEFANMLKDFSEAERDPFFEPLDGVVALEPVPGATLPSLAPTSAILIPPLVITNAGNDGDGGGEVPLVAIIGAAVGGFIFIVVGILLVRFAMRYQAQKQPASRAGSSNSNEHSIGVRKSGANGNSGKGGSKKGANPGDIQPKPSTAESSVYTSATHSQIFAYNSSNSRQLQESDTQSQMGGAAAGDMSVMDNASYAYSLEPGIEPSLAGLPHSVLPSSAASAMSFSVNPGGGSSVASMTSGASSFAFLKFPLGSKSSGGGSPSSKISGRPTVDVFAPAGKLGIVIDTTIDGPVVHKVNPGSALEGQIKSGDIIVAIDGVDTRAMTAASITALMVKTANQRRKLTIVRI